MNQKGENKMKALKVFVTFNWNAFAEGKEFTVRDCSVWTDFNTKKVMGTKVEVIITKDDTDYHLKDGEAKSNLLERLIFKVTKDIRIPANSKVRPVNPRVTAYGRDYHGNFTNYVNQLVIQCDDVEIIP